MAKDAERAEAAFDRDRWMKTFDALPEDRQKELERWFATQVLIMENLGLPEDEWFGLIGWALDNPLDFSFIDAFPDETRGTDVQDGDGDKAAAKKIVGAANDKNVATGAGLKEKASGGGLDRELYQRFMANRMNESATRGQSKKPPPAKPGGKPPSGRR